MYPLEPGRPAGLGRRQMLAESYDLEALVDAVEICREIGASTAFAEWRKVEVAPGSDCPVGQHQRAFDHDR